MHENTDQLERLRSAVGSKPPEIGAAILAGYELSDEGQQLRQGLQHQLLGTLALVQHEKLDTAAASEEPPKPEAKATIQKTRELAQTIRWAESVYEGFIDLPSSNPVRSKKVAKRDDKFIAEKLGSLKGEQGQHIANNPEALAKIAETWTVLAIDGDERGQLFIEKIQAKLYEYGRKHWRELSKEALAGYVRELAHSDIALETIAELLRGHFAGPTNPHDRLRSYIDACLSAQHILKDQQVLKQLSVITQFKTKIIPASKTFHENVFTAGRMVEDDELCKLGRDATIMSDALDRLANNEDPYSDGTLEDGNRFQRKLTGRRSERINSFAVHHRISRSQAKHILETRDKILTHTTEGNFIRTVESAREEIIRKYGRGFEDWATYILFGEEDYYREFLQTFGSRQAVDGLRIQAERDYGYKAGDVVTLPLDTCSAIDILVPEGMTFSADDLKELLKNLRVAMIESGKDVPRDEISMQTDVYMLHHEGKAIMIARRVLSEMDKLSEHSLNQLIYEDIPDLEGDSFQNASEIFQRMEGHEIERCVSLRGFKVDFKSSELRTAGLEGISFKQDPNDARDLLVKVRYRDQSLAYKIDGFGNLDLEGRRLYSEKIQNIIHRRTLAILEYYVTRPVLETSEGSLKANETGTTARIATVVYLPEGKKFTEDAKRYYLEQRGKNLAVKSELRKLSPKARGRNSTFRRATDVDDPSLEPLQIYATDSTIV